MEDVPPFLLTGPDHQTNGGAQALVRYVVAERFGSHLRVDHHRTDRWFDSVEIVNRETGTDGALVAAAYDEGDESR